jgi:hypothetical protein
MKRESERKNGKEGKCGSITERARTIFLVAKSAVLRPDERSEGRSAKKTKKKSE